MGQAGSLRPIGNRPVSCCRNRPRTNRLADLRPRPRRHRYSTPKQIDTKNVTTLVRAWTYHMNAGTPPAATAAPAPGSSEANDAVQGRGRGRGGRGAGAGVTTRFPPGDRRRHVHYHRSPQGRRAGTRNRQRTLDLRSIRRRSRHKRPRLLAWRPPVSCFHLLRDLHRKTDRLNAKTGKPAPVSATKALSI